jgi:Na+-transporting methylmalonyl-CoA/oxaloacetate decarboxylase gamma subunit
MSATLLLVLGAAVVLLVLLVLVGRLAIRRLRRFVRAFWPHS